jgi:hypothetical protein
VSIRDSETKGTDRLGKQTLTMILRDPIYEVLPYDGSAMICKDSILGCFVPSHGQGIAFFRGVHMGSSIRYGGVSKAQVLLSFLHPESTPVAVKKAWKIGKER